MSAKQCRKCGEVKPLSAFGKEARTRDGRRARCRDCTGAASAAWRAANQDHVKAYSAMDAQRRKGYVREWRRANPERVRAYRQTSKADPRDFLTQWRKRHDGAVPAHTETP